MLVVDPVQVLTFGSPGNLEAKFLDHDIYLYVVLQMVLFYLFHHLLNGLSHNKGVGGGALNATSISEGFFSKDSSIPILELVLYKNSTEGGVGLTLVLLRVGLGIASCWSQKIPC